MDRNVITTTAAPAAIGPYSQAIVAGNLVFISGQVPLDPVSRQIVGETIADQTHQVLKNILAVLDASGAGFDTVVRTMIYLTDLAHFAEVNAIYGEYVGADPPARSIIQVEALARGAMIEIDAIAVRR